MTERANGWLKFFLAILPFLVVFAVAGITLNERVSEIKAVQLIKADKATVDVQYEAILREVRGINERLGRLEARQ